MQALEYLGIQDIEPSESTEPDSGNGVIPIMSEALHYKRPGAYTHSGPWGIGGNEPWLDVKRYDLTITFLDLRSGNGMKTE
jgi:ribonuclease Z